MLICIDGFWALHKSTGDERYKKCVRRAFDFAIRELTLSRAYPKGIEDRWFDHAKRVVPFFSHDLKTAPGKKVVAPVYCLGCQFLMLNRIWDYNTDSVIPQSE